MRVFAIGVAAVAVLAAGGYSAFWFHQADASKKALEEAIAELNRHVPVLKYSGIDTSGFPFAIDYSLRDPVISIPVHRTLAAIVTAGEAAENPAVPPLFPSIPENWVEELEFPGGAVVVSTDILGKSFALTTRGDAIYRSKDGDTLATEAISTSAKPLICRLSLRDHFRFADLTRLGNVVATTAPDKKMADEVTNVFSSLECNAEGLETKHKGTGATIFKTAKTMFRFAVSPLSGGRGTADLVIEVQGSEATKEFDAIEKRYQAMLKLESGLQPVIPMSAYGPQDVALTLRYDGPIDEAGAMDAATLDISRFHLKNALYFSDGTFRVAYPGKQGGKTEIRVQMESRVNEEYDTLLRAEAARIVKAVRTAEDPGMEILAMREATKGISEEALTKLVQDALPSFHTLTPVKLEVDADYTETKPAKQESGDEFAAGGTSSLALRKADLVTAKGGVKVKGDMTMAMLAPEGTMELTCLSCLPMVQSLGDYARGAMTLASKFEPSVAAFIPSDQLIEGTKTFLSTLGTKAQGEDLLFAIKSKGEDMSVNGKPVADVTAMFAEHIAPHLEGVAPAAGGGDGSGDEEE